MNRRALVRMIALLLALSLVAVACGDDDADDAAPADDPATDDPAADEEDDAEEPDAEDGEADDAEAGDDAEDDWQAGGGEEWEAVLEAGREEGTVTVAGFPFLADAMAEAFERDTGIALEWVGGSGAENSARMEQEAQAGDLTIDLLLGGGGELITLKPEGLLEPLAPQLILPGVTDGENWEDGQLTWYDDEEQYLLVTAQYIFGWPIVNADEIDPSEIQTWDDLLKPEFEGQIAAYDPTSPGPGQGATGFMVSELGLDYLEELFIGQDVTFTTDNSQLVEWVARGTYPIALFSIQSQVERFKAEGFNIEALLPEDAPGYISSGFSVAKQAVGVPNPNAAQVFLNWYASKPGQEVYEEIMLEASGRSDVEVEAVPDYVRPQPDVEYFRGDLDEEFYTETRQEAIQELTELLGGR
jgi:ABC-type Fe3+ transport system substrate-binding protein